jgi:hypothetical protein
MVTTVAFSSSSRPCRHLEVLAAGKWGFPNASPVLTMGLRLMDPGSRENAMRHPVTQSEPPPPVLGPDDPPIDLPREAAAYAREEERLVREHLGRIALVHGDEVVGVFATADEAIREGFRRFGYVQLMVREIRDPRAPPDFVSLVDFHHPSFKKVD